MPGCCLSVTPFHELSPAALYELLALRQLVFPSSRTAPTWTVTAKIKKALHLLGSKRRWTAGCLRAPARPVSVIRKRRLAASSITLMFGGSGCGRILMQEAISQLVRPLGQFPFASVPKRICVVFYESFGFVAVSDPYDEDGILHILMLRERPGSAANRAPRFGP